MRMRDLTPKAAVTVPVDATIEATAQLMDKHAVGAVVVVDDDRPVGIVTDRDIVVRAVARRSPFDGRIDSVMTSGVVAIDADDDERRAVAIFASHPFRRLPVVEEGRMIGMITVDDLTVVLTRTLDELTTGVTAQLLFGHPEPGPPATRQPVN
jgi:CBS domain-containing protein